jgi:hypothetical protein
MLFKDIRHLLIMDDKNEEFIGMMSVRDLVKEMMKKNEDTITRLSDFKLGKGAFSVVSKINRKVQKYNL